MAPLRKITATLFGGRGEKILLVKTEVKFVSGLWETPDGPDGGAGGRRRSHGRPGDGSRDAQAEPKRATR